MKLNHLTVVAMSVHSTATAGTNDDLVFINEMKKEFRKIATSLVYF